jgi:hypothetical protein
MLNLCNTQVTDAALEHVKELANLETLNLCNTNVTDAGMEYLKGLTKLRLLNVCGTRVTDAGVKHFKKMTNVHWLTDAERMEYRKSAEADAEQKNRLLKAKK